MNYQANQDVARVLRDIADALEQQQANTFRISAYRRAADTIDQLDEDVRLLFEHYSTEGLIALSGIGEGIARTIVEILITGRSSRLEHLRGALDPVRLFATIPGVGPELAARIHDALEVDTLEALEIAAHDGRLAQVPGIGERRIAIIRSSLDRMLGHRVRQRPHPIVDGPSVSLILSVDREYREKAKSGTLPTIAPRRFNPDGTSWLPIMHITHGAWHFTALFSNTARAHQLGRTNDWVVIYHYDDHHHEAQHTVVTETHGPLKGRRVVRGRETECQRFYEDR